MLIHQGLGQENKGALHCVCIYSGRIGALCENACDFQLRHLPCLLPICQRRFRELTTKSLQIFLFPSVCQTNPLLVKPQQECSRSCPAQQLPLRGEAQAVHMALGLQLPVPIVSVVFYRMVSLSPVTISFHLLVHMLHCILGWPDTKSALLCLCMCDSVFSTSLT